VRALITVPATLAVAGVQCVQRSLGGLIRPAGRKRLGCCAACGATVFDSDAFLRYRGEYYHASLCAELDPPALRRALAANR
jgi:hypothetical protein